MPLNPAQKAAVEYLEGPLLVLAGPGTGKTQLLSSKVEYILNNTDASPENVLCLTFTEPGAGNMRDRLYSMIGTDAGKVNIYTYHAFGSSIIAEYKNYATSYERDLDSPIDTVRKHKIISEIQKTLDPYDILKKASTADIISTISSAKSACLTGKDLEKIASDNIATSEKMNPLLNNILQNLKRGMKYDKGVEEIYHPILQVFQNHANASGKQKAFLAPGVTREAQTLAKELEEVITKAGNLAKPSVSPLTEWKRKRFELDENENYRLKNRIANLKLLSLANVMQQYENYLKGYALFDYDDMIQQAIKILREDAGFKATLQERYQYILLDEYQDTNAAQAELIHLLSDYEQPQIMAVGDDDQAIYAFQGASASNLQDFQDYYGAAFISLTQNYRSQSGIIDLSKKIREQISNSYSRVNGVVKDLQANVPGEAQISRHEFVEASAEYHWIAEEIERLVQSGVKQKNIAIITPKHKFVQPLLPYLRAYDDLNIAYEKRDNLFFNKQIHELLTMAKFVYDLAYGDDPAQMLLEVLSFPFLKVPPLSAIKAVYRDRSKKQSTIDFLTQTKDEKLIYLAEFFAELAGQAENAPLELFIDYLTGIATLPSGKKLGYLDYYTNASDPDYATFELYDNLHMVREAILKHTDNPTPHLADLITFMQDYESANEPLISTSPYRDSADAVQIITAHKSKGLEYEYVFTVATDDRAWGNSKGNNNMLALPANLTHVRHTGVTEDERLRLFFVAITRAKSHLYMTNSLKDYAGKYPARLQYLSEYQDDNKHLVSPMLPKKSQEIITHYQNLPDDYKLSDLKTSWISSYQKVGEEIRPLLLSRMENYKLNATDLTTFIDIIYAGPQVFYERKVLLAPAESYSEALTFGNLIHATYEQVTNNKLDDAAALQYFHEQLKTANVPLDDLEDFTIKGEKALATSLQEFGYLFRHENARAEVNLSHEHPLLDDIPLTGKIDHLHINEKEKTIQIYDFKTSPYHSENWKSHSTLFKYMLQLEFYKLLLNLSPAYSKYRVTSGHILFVVPDPADGLVHDKIYEYNEKDEAVLRDLIKAIYKQVKSLDFLDNSDLFIAPDSERKMKDIIDFIQLVLDTNQKEE